MQHHLRRPARAGLDDATVKLVRDYDNILYISCNPETLQANMACSVKPRIARFAPVRPVPWTHHMEAGVYLKRKAADPGRFLAAPWQPGPVGH